MSKADITGTYVEQLELEMGPGEASSNNGSSCFSDPSFINNKTAPIHRWVPWIAGFSNEFVSDVIRRYLPQAGVVLDPFSGVGTTLVEAVLAGHAAVGFEINPYAFLASRVKVEAHRINVSQLRCEISNLDIFYREKVGSNYVPKNVTPKDFRTRSPFYSPKVLRKVLIVLDFIDTIVDSDLQNLFRLAFAATMVRYSNYSYEPSLSRRVTAGKSEIIDYTVERTIQTKLSEMAEDISWMQQKLGDEKPSSRVIHASFFDYRQWIEPDSVDLIITSPPYLNNYHYNRNTRPHIYWLGYASHPNDFKSLEQANFGKYWQTVRDADRMALDFSLPGTDLEDQLDALGAIKPERGIYGGSGWANYAVSYFNDCYRFAQGIVFGLRRGGTAIVVIGNSILQGIMIATDLYFGKIAESLGLELVRIDVPRAVRVGNSIIQSDVRVAKAKKGQQLYEAIVELRKP